MEASSSSADTKPLPRPQFGPYSGLWTRLFDDALSQVLARPSVANPPDVQMPAARLKAALESQRDDITTTAATQIERIDRLVEELHDRLVALLADRSQVELLSSVVLVADTLLRQMRTARDPAAIQGLFTYADTE